MSHYVFSTITNDNCYVGYVVGRDLHQVAKSVLIKGGANRADGSRNIFTPNGVMSIVTDEDMNFLLQNDSFLKHIERGFITHTPYKAEADEVAEDMTNRDGSAQMKPEDFDATGGAHRATTHQPAPDKENKSLLARIIG